MKLQRRTLSPGLPRIIAIAILSIPLFAVGQTADEGEAPAPGVADEKAGEEDAIDEIVVIGNMSIVQLRKEVYRAEENFYAVFSALNDDDEYDIRCFYETPTGTRIRRHVCRAQFVTDAYSAAAERFRTEGPRLPLRDPGGVVVRKRKELQRRMEALIAENPELVEALNRYAQAQINYSSQREERCADAVIACN